MAEVLIKNPKITRFCEVTVEEQHKFEAYYLAQYRWEKEIKEELKKREEEKLKEEQEWCY